METKMITIPFDVELAKKIQAGEHPGKITTRDEKNDVRIVCWDAKCVFPIVALLKDGAEEEDVDMYKSNGSRYEDVYRDYSDLVLQVPEWTQCKEGDIFVKDNFFGFQEIFILKEIKESQFYAHASVEKNTNELWIESGNAIKSAHMNQVKGLATEEDKQQFIDVLKSSTNPRAKDILKRFFGIGEVEKKPKCEVKSEFEPYDRVLCRDSESSKWYPTIFSYYDPQRKHYPYVTVCGCFAHCIHYNEKTKHLVGTTDDWEEEE